MNPYSEVMMNTYYTYRALNGLDHGCVDYIGYASALQGTAQQASAAPVGSLRLSVVKGMKEEAVSFAKTLLQTRHTQRTKSVRNTRNGKDRQFAGKA